MKSSPANAHRPARGVFHFESRHAPLLPRRQFYRRVARTALLGVALLAAALGLGMVGYRVTENMSWIDAFANASMILSGMGPAGRAAEQRGRRSSPAAHALFSGLAFITLVGVCCWRRHSYAARFTASTLADDEAGPS